MSSGYSPTDLLARVVDGKSADELMPLVYDELHDIAQHFLRAERPNHTLQPTALVSEAYLKLIDQSRVDWKGRSHFIAIGARVMRRILVDHARNKNRVKRGGDRQRVVLHDDLRLSPQRFEHLLALEDALEELQELDPTQARIVELRFYGGLTVQEVAEVMGVSKRKVEAEWTMIRAWLRKTLSEDMDS